MTNLEHERFRLFEAKVGCLAILSEAELHALVDEASSDPDGSCRESMLGVIAAHPFLLEAQIASLSLGPTFAPAHLRRHLERNRLLQALATEPLSEPLFGSCVVSGDARVQLALLGHKALTRAHLSVLRQNGANRAVRNLAKQRLGGPACAR